MPRREPLGFLDQPVHRSRGRPPARNSVGALTTPKFKQSIIALFRQAGRQIRDEQDLESQAKTITNEERAKIGRLGAPHLTQLIDPAIEFRLALNKEVAPGCRFPLSQWVRFFQVGEDGLPFETQNQETRILTVKVNEPLPEALFAVEFNEGERIQDQTTNPLVTYRYKPKLTQEEWSTIIAEAKKKAKRDPAREARNAALIAQPAKPFPPTAAWLNGNPLTLKELAGKRVLLVFWAEWSDACRNELSVLAGLIANRPRGPGRDRSPSSRQ